MFIYAAFCFAGTDIQNGGGGLTINGSVATFYSARIKIDPDPIDELDGILDLEQVVYQLKIDSESKLAMIKKISPGFDRKYFKAESINPEVLEQIKKDYQKVTGIDASEITLFAITNTQTQNTLLLPDFFLLKPAEKMAILFHESMWLSGHINSLADMLKLEYVFQQYIEEKTAKSEYEFYSLLENTYNRRSWLFRAAISKEVELYRQVSLKNPILGKILSTATLEWLAKFYLSQVSNAYGDQSYNANSLVLSLMASPSKHPAFKYSYMSFLHYFSKNTNVLPYCLIAEETMKYVKASQYDKALDNLKTKLLFSNSIDFTENGFIIGNNTNDSILNCTYRY